MGIQRKCELLGCEGNAGERLRLLEGCALAV